MAKILVIDDDQSIVELLGLRLTEAGHVVVTALDGSSGPMIASREKPDLIILDYNMPAANGAKVHERLRGNSFTAGTPIIFLTATPIGEIITMVKDDALTRFLQKPVDFGLLAKTMAAFLPGPAPAAPASAPPPPAPAKLYDPDAPPGAVGDVLDLD
ncbi:MAG: response regulator [Elusimicrobia bacterium]|nr:response regulator [Elusimicrobiota bacterium]